MFLGPEVCSSAVGLSRGQGIERTRCLCELPRHGTDCAWMGSSAILGTRTTLPNTKHTWVHINLFMLAQSCLLSSERLANSCAQQLAHLSSYGLILVEQSHVSWWPSQKERVWQKGVPAFKSSPSTTPLFGKLPRSCEFTWAPSGHLGVAICSLRCVSASSDLRRNKPRQ